jgi:hypothetical protein
MLKHFSLEFQDLLLNIKQVKMENTICYQLQHQMGRQPYQFHFCFQEIIIIYIKLDTAIGFCWKLIVLQLEIFIKSITLFNVTIIAIKQSLYILIQIFNANYVILHAINALELAIFAPHAILCKIEY